MALFFLHYSILIILICLTSLFFYKKEKLFSYIPSVGTSIVTLLALVLLACNFNNLHKNDVISIFNWQLPFSSFNISLDGLSGFFLIPLLILTIATMLYSSEYFNGHKSGITHWLSMSLLISGMVMVLLSRNGILFLISWEIMSVASFFLVITHNEDPRTLYSGWIYFIATHIGTAFLITAFLLLASTSHSFDFDSWDLSKLSSFKLNLIFIFVVIAFGMKAGFIPFHIWLPLAHPEAPSHVSALMSGIMIKMGVYGILRIMLYFPTFEEWWGVLFIIIGSVSGILGVLFAIGQHDLKKLLAYHSVENIGIIFLGIGVGILGVSYHLPLVATFGFAGGLLHIMNHSIFKGLLFLGAGAVIRQTGSGKIDILGGLIKKMPWTANLFLLGAVAICGLPFFNGFISEIFIYVAALVGTVNGNDTLFTFMNAFTVISLATIGGFACACFTKVIGVIFLGEIRDKSLGEITEVPFLMRSSMCFLSVFMLIIGMLSFAVVPFLRLPLQELIGNGIASQFDVLCIYSKHLSLILFIMLAVILLVIYLRLFIFKRNVVLNETWGCAYTKPDQSMQYTASSFAQPLTDIFKTVLNGHKEKAFSNELFPSKDWKYSSHSNDWILNNLYIPFFKCVNKLLSLLRWIQCGKVGLYTLYIVLTIIVLIIWMLLKWS